MSPDRSIVATRPVITGGRLRERLFGETCWIDSEEVGRLPGRVALGHAPDGEGPALLKDIEVADVRLGVVRVTAGAGAQRRLVEGSGEDAAGTRAADIIESE